jgi:hypothetical protein
MQAVAICAGIVVVATIFSPECLHWFVIPLFLCGVICCFDGLLLFANGGENLFKPVPMLGAFGLYFFLIAPLLHVVRDYWYTSLLWAPKEVPDDWRTWLGLMGCINLIGLAIYKALFRWFVGRFSRGPASTSRRINLRYVRSFGVLITTLVLSLQIYFYVRFGGIGGFVGVFGSTSKGDASEFSGMGWQFAISESFPVLLVIVCVSLFKSHFRNASMLRLGFYLTVVFVIALLCGGLRGGRGNTIYTMVYIVGIIHLTVRRFRTRHLVLGATVMLGFMYIYGFYKSNPLLFTDPGTLISSLSSSESRTVLESRTHRDLNMVLMGDLDRADLQAHLLFRMIQGSGKIGYAFGRTYIEGAMNFIPRTIFKDRPPGKLMYGTNASYGEGTYSPERKAVSSRIYGVAGEMMLNFGAFSAPLGFVLLAAFVGYVQASYGRLPALDSRRYLAPIMSVACIVFVSADIDNVIFLLLQHALMPYFLVRSCSVGDVGRRRCFGHKAHLSVGSVA